MAPILDASVVGGSLTWHTTVPVPLLLSSVCGEWACFLLVQCLLEWPTVTSGYNHCNLTVFPGFGAQFSIERLTAGGMLLTERRVCVTLYSCSVKEPQAVWQSGVKRAAAVPCIPQTAAVTKVTLCILPFLSLEGQ